MDIIFQAITDGNIRGGLGGSPSNIGWFRGVGDCFVFPGVLCPCLLSLSAFIVTTYPAAAEAGEVRGETSQQGVWVLTRAAAEGEFGLSHKRWQGQNLGFPDSLSPVKVVAGRNWPSNPAPQRSALWCLFYCPSCTSVSVNSEEGEVLSFRVAGKRNQNHGRES